MLSSARLSQNVCTWWSVSRSDDGVWMLSSPIHSQNRSTGSSGGGGGGPSPISSSRSSVPSVMRRAMTESRSRLLKWLSHEMATSRGSRATQMYVTRGSSGMQSKGECVFMKRRCVCAASWARTFSAERVCTSTHGESSVNGAGRSVVWKMRSAQIICVHVVPHFDGVEMMMSSSRSGMPSHLALSMIRFRCRPTGPPSCRRSVRRVVQPEQLDRRLAHQVLLHLAGDRHRELVGHVHVPRHLEVCDLAATELGDIVRGQRRAFSHAHPRHDLLAVLLVGDSDHLHVDDVGVRVEELLDLAGI